MSRKNRNAGPVKCNAWFGGDSLALPELPPRTVLLIVDEYARFGMTSLESRKARLMDPGGIAAFSVGSTDPKPRILRNAHHALVADLAIGPNGMAAVWARRTHSELHDLKKGMEVIGRC